MSKGNGALGAVGKVITYILVVLFVLGIAGMVAYFALRSQGVTYYVEYGGAQYFSNGDGGSIPLKDGETHTFSVKSLTGGEVNYDVKVVSNSSNNFTFSYDGLIYQFVSTTEENNDYSEVFGLHKMSDSFSITIPKDFSVEQAIELRYGGDIELSESLDKDKAYFVVSVTADDGVVNLWFLFGIDVTSIILNPPQIIF